MDFIFEITDKTGRKIRLTRRQWSHIRKKHPEVENLEMLENVLQNPDRIINYNFNLSVNYYYKFFKDREPPNRFLCIAVKYLNGEGYIITTYFNKRIK